jgi:translocation and assembly module TamB
LSDDPTIQDEPSPEAEAVETPAKAEKRKRTRLQMLGFLTGCILGVVVLLALAGVIGGRSYLLTDSGRGLVTSFVAGKKISRYGRINVEGLKGDLFDDFTLERVTITDRKGVWLEARNVRVDWSYWPLVTRRFHAETISADVIRVIRRPEIDPPDGRPPSPQPIDVDIDRFQARLELLEGFSKEYGRWDLGGSVALPRRGSKTAKLDALSLNRPGDYLKLDAVFGGKLDDLRLDLRANEARGGPLAGAMGYSPDRPFSAIALVDGELINATIRTGDFRPLSVQGHYGPNGARVSGYADFSGSDLFKPFVDRIGQTARFGFAAVPDAKRKGFQGVAWRLYADNIESHAVGMLKMSDRSAPDGIRLEIATPNLSRLSGVNLGAATSWTGVFRGGQNDFSLQGQASLADAHLASYRAQRISGPLNAAWRAGKLTLDTDIRGMGGRADGIVGALLGATPHVIARATREKDGAVVLNRIDATGQALKATGTGGRNLLGGLSFRGNAAITDVSRIRPGARGAFGGPIAASSPRSGAPWTLRFDGRGTNLRNGMEELDRLLGASPRLRLAGSLNDGRIAIETGQLTGAAGRADAKGLIEADGRLRLALDWDARGPFGVGPVAIDGTMTGKGALTGTLAEPRADLTAAFDKVAAGPLTLTQTNLILSFRKGADASDGRVTLSAGSNYGPATASGNFFLGGPSIRLSDVNLDAGGVKAQGAVALSNQIPSSADLTFSARPGAFFVSGSAEGRVRLIDGGGPNSALVDVTARNLRMSGSSWVVRSLDVDGSGTLDRLPLNLSVDVGGANPVQFNGAGVYMRTGENNSLTLRGGGRVREVAFVTRNPAVLALAGEAKIARLDLTVGGGVLTGEARLDDEGAAIDANLTAVELGSIISDLRGQVTGRISLRGQGERLTGSANVAMRQLRSLDGPRGLAVDGSIEAVLDDETLSIKATADDDGNVRAAADLVLPVEASAAPLRLAIVRTRNLSGHVSLNGQIQPIWDLFLGGERSLAGQVDGQARLGGSVADPRIDGTLTVKNGSFRDTGTGLRLNALEMDTRFDGTTALIQSFSANDGSGGTVSGDGRIGLREGSGSNFELALRRFRIIDNDIAEARASGPVTVVRGADGNITLTGQIDVDEARIEANPPGSNGVVSMDVIEINRPGGDIPEEEQASRSRGPQFGLDIQLRSPGGDVRVVGRGLNVELNVNARVGGTVAQPQLTGTARVVRGDYEFAGKRFVFDDRGTVNLSTDPNLIRLNLTAVREDPSLTATIVVTGTAASPKIELTSSPQLPQDEILSQVLFGRSASQLSAFEAAQLAAGVAALAGGGGFDVIGNLRELAGLDRLSFGGEASALTVAGGRYITDDVYLEIIGGGEGGAAVNVEWQVRRNLAISSKFGGTGEATLSIRWRRASRPPGARNADTRPNANQRQ